MKAENTKAEETNEKESTAAETNAAETQTPQWKTYRTRFLVNAKQLGCPLVFTDSLGRRHSGRKGDYLVESSDGVLSIAPRKIFEDIYVSMAPDAAGFQQDSPALPLDQPTRVRRKLPQPCSGAGSLRGTRVQGSGVSGRENFYATGL